MMNRILHITYSVTEDCKNDGGAYGEICTRCNKCGRWGGREEADDTEG
jgi:hypothetical protein